MNDTEITDTLPVNEPRGNSNPHEKYVEGAPMHALIQRWHTKRKEDIHRKVASSSAATSRMKYRLERRSEGKIVRPYSFHDHEPQQPTETRVDYERRLSRDRARARRGADAQSVRPWTDLSLLSLEEKLLHQRKLASERQAKRRARQSQLLVDNETSAMEDALKESEIEWGMF